MLYSYNARFHSRGDARPGRAFPTPSNQTAELTAIIKASELARKAGWRKDCIVSDSKYALNAVENLLPRWLENWFRDCKNEPVANQDRIKELIEATQGLDIEWRFTEDHAGDFGDDKADELARNAITSTVTCALVINFGKEQLADPDIKKTYEEIAKQGGDTSDRYRMFRVIDELLNYVYENEGDPRLVVPKQQRLRLAHGDESYGGHLGVRKTMKKLVLLVVRNVCRRQSICTFLLCQQFKNPKGEQVGKLCNIPVSRLFERLHLDIISPMHSNTKKTNKYVMTGIDAYSRFAFARAFPDSRTEFCMDFLQDIIALHGVPDYIVTDQGPQYMSVEWGDLMRKFHIKHNRTNAYHPQSNGMDERLNSSLMKIVRAYTVEKPDTWDIELRWALFAYNTSFHESLRMTPYEAMFGCQPRTPLNPQPRSPLSPEDARGTIHQALSANDEFAKSRQRYYNDRNRVDSQYQVGDSVLLKNHAHTIGQSRKLQPKWIGPAIILGLPQPNPQIPPVYAKVPNFYKGTKIHHVPLADMKPYYYKIGSSGFQTQVGLSELLTQRTEAAEEPDVPIPPEFFAEDGQGDLEAQLVSHGKDPEPEPVVLFRDTEPEYHIAESLPSHE